MIIIPLSTALIIPVLGLMRNRIYYWVALLSLLATFFISITLFVKSLIVGTIHYNFGGWQAPWGIEYVITPFNSLIIIISIFVGISVFIYSTRLVDEEIDSRPPFYYSLFLLSITGVIGILITGDLFNLYVFTEIMSLSIYTLAASGKKKDCLVSSFTYLVLGTIGASFVLIGIGYLYMVTGTLNMADMAVRLNGLYDSKVVISALVFFIVGLSIKMALFPLHSWLPFVHGVAPFSIKPFIGGVIPKIGVYALIKVLFTVFGIGFLEDATLVKDYLVLTGSSAVIFGSVMAIKQKDVRWLFAYSTVSHIGLIAIGIGIGTKLAVIGATIHILGHALMKSSLFMIAGMVNHKTKAIELDDYTGMFKKMPFTMVALGTIIYSMIGLPLSVGFVSKFFLILAAIEIKLWPVVIIIILSSILSILYFWQLVQNAFFKSPVERTIRTEAPAEMIAPVLVSSVVCIIFGFLAFVPISIIEKGVSILFKT